MARAPAPAQPEGFKAGLFDVVFTATSCRRGIIPEVDALSGNTTVPRIGCAFVVLADRVLAARPDAELSGPAIPAPRSG